MKMEKQRMEKARYAGEKCDEMVAREKISHVILGRLDGAISCLEDIASQLNNRLEPVSQAEVPSPISDVKEMREQYPPLFSEIRILTDRINYVNSKLEDMRQRLEI